MTHGYTLAAIVALLGLGTGVIDLVRALWRRRAEFTHPQPCSCVDCAW